MKPHNRKLQLTYDDAPLVPNPINTLTQNYSFSISTSSPSLPPPPASQPRTPLSSPQLNHRQQQQQQQQQQQYLYANTHFDASMALTLLVLLTALSFMGFFSIYVRRFASDDSTADYSPHGRRQRDHPPTSRMARSGARKGADPEVVKSLPVYSYYHGEAKYQIDCAICLGEFEEKEAVKMIPHCQHVFHVHCIDTWLKLHVTCPVCRGTQFIKLNARGGAVATGGGGRRVGSQACERSTAEDGETWIEIGAAGPSGLRRASSCSSLGEGGLLQRTSSL